MHICRGHQTVDMHLYIGIPEIVLSGNGPQYSSKAHSHKSILIASTQSTTTLRDSASMNFVDLHSKKSDEHVIQTESYLLIFDLKGTNGEHKNNRPILKISQEPNLIFAPNPVNIEVSFSLPRSKSMHSNLKSARLSIFLSS